MEIKEYLGIADKRVEVIVKPLESDMEALGRREELFVQGVLTELEEGIEKRTEIIEGYRDKLLNLEKWRKKEALERLKVMVDKCTGAAHVSPGELERIVEAKTLAVNNLTLQNSAKASDVYSRLTVQNMERAKEHRRRWYEGLLRWKRQKHVTAVEICVERIESREFRHSPKLVDMLQSLRDKQLAVFEERKELIFDVFETAVDDLSSAQLRTVEEKIQGLNEQNSEWTDRFFEDFKALTDSLREKVGSTFRLV